MDNILEYSAELGIHSLQNNLSLNDTTFDEEDVGINIIQHSPYLVSENRIVVLKSKCNCFTILSSNVGSIHKKLDELQICIDELPGK